MSPALPFRKRLIVALAAAALILQGMLAWMQGGNSDLGRMRHLASAAFTTRTLGRPVADANDAFVSWADRNTSPRSVILLLQPAGNADSFRYFRTAALAYPRTVWWGDANGPGPYPDWHIDVPAAPQALAGILARYGVDYLMVDGVPQADWSFSGSAAIIWYNQKLMECLVDVRGRQA